MSELSAVQRQELQDRFGRWVRFDRAERRIYSHDVAELPGLVRPLMGAATADAVVQPGSEDEVVALVRWANRHHVHLVPRAKATSGYGGVVPVKGGVSVALLRLKRVLAVDPARMTVKVQPGVVWQDLETHLAARGLALRTYPSSAPASTVGGWLCQGGVGFGAYEYDRFLPNVIAARVVSPDAQVRTYAGDDLALIGDAEGITGIVTEVALRVRPLSPQRVEAVQFPSAQAMVKALQRLTAAGAPFWSVSFVNPTTARLHNRLPPRSAHGQPVDEARPVLPEQGFRVLLAAPESRWVELEPLLATVLAETGGAFLDQALAEHEWARRFAVMHPKRLGPSLLPAEAIVPLANLGPALEDMEGTVRQPMLMEGMVQRPGDGGEPQVTLLCFIPHDARTLRFGVAFGLSLSVLRAARRHGGRPFSTGLFFSGQADAVLGGERARRLREAKRELDPAGLLNPGKVVSGGLLPGLINLAFRLEPALRIAGNACTSPLGERIEGASRRGIPDDLAWYAHACAQCGYCVDDCDQYYGRGWESESPRGKWFFLRDYMAGRAEWSQEWVNNILACTTCEMCNVTCPLELPNEPSWMKLRGLLVHEQDRLTLPPFEVMRAAAEKELNIWGAYNRDRDAWLPDDLRRAVPERAETAYFAGCTASFVDHNIPIATTRLLREAGVEFTYLGENEACCGLPIYCAGHWDTFEKILRHNIAAMRAKGVKRVVTSCPACWLAWHTYYPQWAGKLGIPFDIETRHYSEVLADAVREGRLTFDHRVEQTITWHDSCHIGRAGGVYEPPREVLRAIPGVELVEMKHNRERALCCGSVLSILDSPEDAAVEIGRIRLEEARAAGASALAAACPCCEVQLRISAQKSGTPLPVVDLGKLAAAGIGLDLPDPTAHVLAQWGTFDAMIKLLRPEQMARFMAGMLPRMIEVMPQPFRGMMHLVQRSPAPVREPMLGMMRPMLPVLFPRLLPGMMPRMMPEMLAAMERVVPMPQSMREQMPELMPKVMGRLLPKMLPEVIPHFVPRLEDYLRTRVVR